MILKQLRLRFAAYDDDHGGDRNINTFVLWAQASKEGVKPSVLPIVDENPDHGPRPRNDAEIRAQHAPKPAPVPQRATPAEQPRVPPYRLDDGNGGAPLSPKLARMQSVGEVAPPSPAPRKVVVGKSPAVAAMAEKSTPDQAAFEESIRADEQAEEIARAVIAPEARETADADNDDDGMALTDAALWNVR